MVVTLEAHLKKTFAIQNGLIFKYGIVVCDFLVVFEWGPFGFLRSWFAALFKIVVPLLLLMVNAGRDSCS